MKSHPTLTQWLNALSESVSASTLVKASLTLPTPAADDLKSVDIRPITVKRELKLSFTYHHKTRDIVKNYLPSEAEPHLIKLLNQSFIQGKVFTLGADILISKKSGSFVLTRHGATQKETLPLSHDRAKHRPLESANKPYLHALGLTDANGAILKSAQDKFRQINKYIEILDALLKQIPAQPVLRVADMGSGKGYLTFALYDHLTSNLGLKAEIVGVEYRADMVQLCNDIAKESGFTGLSFVQGTIGDFNPTGTHVVIALHACDTATDDALAKAIKANADLIVVAPCCHKQIRRSLKTEAKHSLAFLLQYGTYEEKMAEMVTDSLRSHILSLHNYTTNLFEFIGGEHTPKNVMITAIRNPEPLAPERKTAIQTLVQQAKFHFGIAKHHLETLLNPS